MSHPKQSSPTGPEAPERGSLASLFTIFLRVGATGFGGAMALLALVEEHAVERHHVATHEEFAEGVALGQVLPGPVVVDTATHIGYCVRGLLGAVVASGALLLPAFLLMLVLTPLYLSYGTLPHVGGAFRGIGGAVVAVIIAATWRMAQKSLTDAKAIATAAVALVLVAVLGANAALVVLLAGAVGTFVFRPRGGEKA